MHDTQLHSTDIAATVLIVPGIGDSGAGHWQSLWQAANPGFQRVVQRDWDHPVCREWVAALEHALKGMPGPVVLVAHSLGCLLVAHWAASTMLTLQGAVQGALLVSVPDPLGARFPVEAQGFAPLPWTPLPFPSVMVASRDDPYGPMPHAEACAAAWGSRLVNIGAAGHINAASGLGHWPAGQALLQTLLR